MRERERERESVCVLYRTSRLFLSLHGATVLFSFLTSFRFSLLVILWLQTCAVDVGNLTFNVPPHEYQIGADARGSITRFLRRIERNCSSRTRVMAPLFVKLFFRRRHPSTIAFSSTILLTNVSLSAQRSGCGKFYSYSYKSCAVYEVNLGIDSERYGMKDGESKDLR